MKKIDKPVWVKMEESELKETVLKLAEKNSPSQIGLILRDQYGIPTTKIFGKKLGEYLKELGIERNEELENAGNKVSRIKEHLKKNVTDKKAKHKLQKAQSGLNKIKKHSNK